MKWLQIFILVLIVLPTTTLANGVSIRPFLIDNTMVPREIVTETVLLENEYPSRTAIIYATVNEITVGTDGEIKEFVAPVMTDRTNSITSWLEITRGRIEIKAGETTEIPLTIKVHPYAEPGEYHAFLGFVENKKRNAAEQIALNGDANGVIVKVTVSDERVESMRITSMTVDRLVTDSSDQQVAITIENSGELESAPVGELIFYNSRGVEISAVEVNTKGETISPDSSKTFMAAVPAGETLGRFKANANLLYGDSQRASLYDTTSFFMLPLFYVYLGIGILSLLLLLLLLLMRRSNGAIAMSEDGEDVPMFVRDGHTPNPKHHDIDLTD